MPKLLDANVWLPLVWDGHVACESAHRWAEAQSDDLVFCRVTELALLRHLTNPAILGEDALTNTRAARLLDALLAREEIALRPEPHGIGLNFPRLGEEERPSHHRWTDAYLAAFSMAGNLELVTYDRGFSRYEAAGLRWSLLEA